MILIIILIFIIDKTGLYIHFRFVFYYVSDYRYYKANKPTPYTEGAPHHEKRPWIYDPADGLVMCLTARDVRSKNNYTPDTQK